jgi:hypothetical protein
MINSMDTVKDVSGNMVNTGNPASELIKELITEMTDTWNIVNDIFDFKGHQGIPASEIFEEVIMEMKKQMGFAATVSA